jgi:short-subunit dehydrogenase
MQVTFPKEISMSNSSPKGTTLITGASSGIGKVYADRLARRGYDLILVARDKARLDELAAKLTAETGVKTDVLQADLTDKSDLARVERRLQDDAAITMLVNNAGLGGSGPFATASLDSMEKIIQLNVLAVTRLAAVAAPAFAKRKRGTVINVGSVLGLAPEMFPGNYSATKAYVLALTQSLHTELGKSGVTFQAVLPGATRTEIWERTGTKADDLSPEMLMEVDEMVDAALAGLDLGELVTIPSLPNIADYQSYDAARLHLGPNLSRNHAADRYKVAAVA